MPDYSATVEAVLAGDTVKCAVLAKFEFTTATRRVWEGFGDLVTGAETYQGLGDMGRIGATDLSPGLAADPIDLTLSGLASGLVAIAKAQKTEVIGQPVTLFHQFFGPSAAEAWKPLDAPYPFFAGIMDTMSVQWSQAEVSITVKCNHLLYLKHRPPYGMWSHFDQQKRFPGDLGLERIPRYKGYEVKWAP